MTALIRWRKTAKSGPMAYSLDSGGHVPTARPLEALMRVASRNA
jgi:hypothetical protein